MLFGDPVGLPQLLRVVEGCEILAVVGAVIRPQQHGAIAALAGGIGAPFLIQPRARDADHADFRSKIAALAPDLIVVNSYSMILQPDVLALPRHGAVNVHGALLPAYRGANVTEWALINGERSIRDMARVLVEQRLMSPQEAEANVRLFLARLHEESETRHF